LHLHFRRQLILHIPSFLRHQNGNGALILFQGSISRFLRGGGKALFRNGGLLPDTPPPSRGGRSKKPSSGFFVRRGRAEWTQSLLHLSVDTLSVVWKSAMLPLLSSKESRPPRQVETDRKNYLMHPKGITYNRWIRLPFLTIVVI